MDGILASETACPACRGDLYIARRDDVGYDGHVTMLPCPDPQGLHSEAHAQRLASISGLLPEEMALRLDEVDDGHDGAAGMVSLARQFIDAPWGFLVFWGGYGNGKTLVLQAVVNEFRAKKHVIGTYVRFYDLLEHIRAGYGTGAEFDARARYERLKTLPLLAIDECDGAKMTEFAEEFRRTFLDDRYRQAAYGKAHTLFALNRDPATLPGDIYDRLRDGRFVIYENADPSMRPALTWTVGHKVAEIEGGE